MANGRWQVAGGKSQVAGGKSQVAGGSGRWQWQVAVAMDHIRSEGAPLGLRHARVRKSDDPFHVMPVHAGIHPDGPRVRGGDDE